MTTLKAGFVICLNCYVMILSLESLSSDTDSRTVNMATLTVWRLGTRQYYVHVKAILNSVTTTKHYQIKNLKI